MKSQRNTKRKPTHPGAILREDILPNLQLTQAQFADRLGVSRLTVSDLVLEKRGVTPEMAIRLGKLLRTSAESWLRMQEAVDLWTLNQKPERFEEVEALPKQRLSA